MPFKNNSLSVFEKNIQKNAFLCIQHYVMHRKNKFCMQNCFFLRNFFLSTKFDLRLKKKIWGQFKITWKTFCCRREKNASHTISTYLNYMIKFFFWQNVFFLFYLVR